MADNDKPVQRITSLADYAPEEIDVQIEYPDHIEIIPMRTLSYFQVMKINASVPDPKPKISDIDPSTKRPLFDTNDPAYLQALGEAIGERTFRQLVAALCIDIPGADEAEKVEYLKGLSNARIQGLGAALRKIMEIGEAQLLARAETFHGDGTAHPEDLSSDGLVETAVEATA